MILKNQEPHKEFKGAITPSEVGNFTKVTKVYSSPDLSPFISGELLEPYRTISLRDTATVTRGTVRYLEIGVARARAFEHRSGGEDGSNSHLTSATGLTLNLIYILFDIRMFTKLTLSANFAGSPSGGVHVGAKITGSTSGATGFVQSAVNNLQSID